MERVIKTFKKFDATASTIIKNFDEVSKKIHENYIGGTYETEYAKAKELYDEAMAQAREEALAAIREAFADMNAKIQNFVMQPAPADFISTLEAIKTMGATVTEQEGALYFEKYRSNYMAGRAIANYLQEMKKYFFRVPSYDEIKADLASLENQAEDFIRKYKMNSYTTKLFTLEERNPWAKEAEKLQKFLAGDVSAVAVPIENK